MNNRRETLFLLRSSMPTRKYILITLILIISACAASEEFIRPETNLKKYKRIAVLPLTDYPWHPGSGSQVADLISMRLLTSSLKIVDRSQAMLLLAEQFLQIGIVDENTAPQIGKFLGVQAILTGSISEWQSTETNIQVVQGFPPAMMSFSAAGISLKLIDIETGQIVWAGSARGSGVGENMQVEFAKIAVNKLIKQFIARIQ